MKKDSRQSFDEFYSPTDVAEVVSGYEELAAADARSRKFNSDVFGILSKHVPQVLFAIGIGVVVGGLVRGEAKAAGHDGFHGGRHVGPDDSGDGGNHTSIGSTQILRTDGMQAWFDSHIMKGLESNVPEKSMLDATGLSFESLWGLGQVDLVDLTAYGDEGSFGTRAIMDQAIFDLGQNKIDVDLSKVFIATFSDDLTVVRSASTSSNGRPSVGSEMGENSSIVFAFDKDGNPHAVFDVNDDGQATGIRPNSKNTQIAILDLVRGEKGSAEENMVGYNTKDGRFVKLIDFTDMNNVKITVPRENQDESASSVKIRARISASDFPTITEQASSSIINTEAGQFVQKIMVDLKIPEGELDLKLVDGKLVCTEVATGDVVCDENGLFTLDYMQEVLTRLDIVGGPSELPDRNSGRPNQIKYGSPIKAYSVQMAIDFRQAYIDQFGIDPFDGSLQNGKIERILIGNDKWATAMGKPENGESVFRNLAFRLEADPSKVVWYPISPTTASQIDAIWSD